MSEPDQDVCPGCGEHHDGEYSEDCPGWGFWVFGPEDGQKMHVNARRDLSPEAEQALFRIAEAAFSLLKEGER